MHTKHSATVTRQRLGLRQSTGASGLWPTPQTSDLSCDPQSGSIERDERESKPSPCRPRPDPPWAEELLNGRPYVSENRNRFLHCAIRSLAVVGAFESGHSLSALGQRPRICQCGFAFRFCLFGCRVALTRRPASAASHGRTLGQRIVLDHRLADSRRTRACSMVNCEVS